MRKLQTRRVISEGMVRSGRWLRASLEGREGHMKQLESVEFQQHMTPRRRVVGSADRGVTKWEIS